MEKRGNKVYLTPQEAKDSGFQSPIDLEEFDLHAERTAADAELDRINELLADVGEDLAPKELHSDLSRAYSRSRVTRLIAKEWAIDSLIDSTTIPDDPSSLIQ